MKIKTKPNPKKALQALHRLKELGLGDHFKGMTEEEVLKELKRTREELWKEKLANRP